MTTIYALVICISSSGLCNFPENGMQIFRSAEGCQRYIDYANEGARGGPGGTNTPAVEYKCYQKPVQTWTPTQ